MMQYIKVDCYNFFIIYIYIYIYIYINDWKTYYQKNRETILNKTKKYYNDNNEVLKERAISK